MKIKDLKWQQTSHICLKDNSSNFHTIQNSVLDNTCLYCNVNNENIPQDIHKKVFNYVTTLIKNLPLLIYKVKNLFINGHLKVYDPEKNIDER